MEADEGVREAEKVEAIMVREWKHDKGVREAERLRGCHGEREGEEIF